MKVQDKVIVVTGGGSGMGRELALLLLRKGAKVAIADINEAGMQETAELAGENKNRLSTHQLNIMDKDAVYALPKAVIETHGSVDGIINNAGIIQPFIHVNDLEYDLIERIFNVNFYGAVYMVKAFLPYLLDRPEAHIANVSSMGGFIPVPGQTMYGASKAAVKLLTEGLYAELKDTNVKVTLIYPGAVNTNITGNSGVETHSNADAENSSIKPLDPSEAARIMIEAIEKDKYHVMVGKDASFLNLFYRFFPDRATNFIAKKMKSLLS